MKIKPIGDRVVVKIEEMQEKTKSGLFIPTQAQEKTYIGEVVAIGDSKEIPVKVGESVLYNKYSGTEISDGDKKCIILKVEDILAIVSK